MSAGELVVTLSVVLTTAFLTFLVTCDPTSAGAATAPAKKLSIRATDKTITCTIPHREDNRWIQAGVYDWWTSARQLDGLTDPGVIQFAVPHLGCDSDTDGDVQLAFCRLIRADGTDAIVTANIPCRP